MIHVAPRDLGDVDQAVDAVEVDKGPEVDDVRDLPLHDHPGLESPEDLLANLLALLLEDGPAREDHVVAAPVQLDHLALERLALELVEVVDTPDVHQRGGQAAAHAEVEDQPALDDLDHRPLDRLDALDCGLALAPRPLATGALRAALQAAFLVARRPSEC